MAGQRQFDNKAFWNERYRGAAEIGSGAGSRGFVIPYKRRLVSDLIRTQPIATVLDIGCGDLCFYDEALFRSIDYHGVDISDSLVATNKAAYPHLTFSTHDISAEPLPLKADLVICFDVLIHQIDAERFNAVLANTLGCVGAFGLLSYKTPPAADGSVAYVSLGADATAEERALEDEFQRMRSALPRYAHGQTAFHGPLPDKVREIGGGYHVDVVGQYRFQTIYLLTRTGPSR